MAWIMKTSSHCLAWKGLRCLWPHRCALQHQQCTNEPVSTKYCPPLRSSLKANHLSACHDVSKPHELMSYNIVFSSCSSCWAYLLLHSMFHTLYVLMNYTLLYCTSRVNVQKMTPNFTSILVHLPHLLHDLLSCYRHCMNKLCIKLQWHASIVGYFCHWHEIISSVWQQTSSHPEAAFSQEFEPTASPALF